MTKPEAYVLYGNVHFKTRWTKAQTDFLEVCFGILPDDDLVRMIGLLGPDRTAEACEHKARELGITKWERRATVSVDWYTAWLEGHGRG